MTAESRYIEKESYLSHYAHERAIAMRESEENLAAEFTNAWFQSAQEELPKFIPFLTRKCGVHFRGRILEIGAGGAWLSAELSKLPNVVEIYTTDFSPKLLKEQAPKVFRLLKAHAAKITRTPADFHKLGFPDDYFDFVVSSAVLHHATNMVQLLREVKRVLKPGGRFVAIREPLAPLVRIKSRSKTRKRSTMPHSGSAFYTLAHYREFFAQAGLPLEVKRVNLSRGFRYYVNKVVNGLTHARYAFVGIKRVKANRAPAKDHSGTGKSPNPLRSARSRR